MNTPLKRHVSVDSLRQALAFAPRPLTFVPTMGALHEGHRQLLRAAREKAGPKGTVVASIFINPIQFDRPEDLKNYPQPLDQDLFHCAQEGVDHVFLPQAESFYCSDRSITVTENLLTRHLCGSTRPGHFDGVLTVVLKLLNIVQPDCAVFGQKDYQQLAVIRRMVRDLNLSVSIVAYPTVREKDGLALSSRNRRLTPEQRADAPRIHRALLAARDLRVTGQQNPEVYLQAARHHLLHEAPETFSIDYLQLVDSDTLQPVSKVIAPCVLAAACFYGEVRLIDNVELIRSS